MEPIEYERICLSKTKNSYRLLNSCVYKVLLDKMSLQRIADVEILYQMRHFSDWMYHVAGGGRRDTLI